MEATTDSARFPALANAGGGADVGSAGFPAEKRSEQGSGKSGKETKTIAARISARVSKVLRGLPLSKLKIVIGKPELPDGKRISRVFWGDGFLHFFEKMTTSYQEYWCKTRLHVSND